MARQSYTPGKNTFTVVFKNKHFTNNVVGFKSRAEAREWIKLDKEIRLGGGFGRYKIRKATKKDYITVLASEVTTAVAHVINKTKIKKL